MSYAGYLLKFGSKILPNSYLTAFKATPNQRTENYAYRDGNNDLQRATIDNHKSKIEFTVKPMLLDEKIVFQNIINSGIVIPTQRKCLVEYWNDETNSYQNGYFYIPDIIFTYLDATALTLVYAPTNITLIEY